MASILPTGNIFSHKQRSCFVVVFSAYLCGSTKRDGRSDTIHDNRPFDFRCGARLNGQKVTV